MSSSVPRKCAAQAWDALKRLCIYLVGLPRLVFRCHFQHAGSVEVHTDTDWAGCPGTRNSTNGGCIVLGSHTIKTWSSTQSSVSLSSGEAEFNGVAKGAGACLGYQSLLRDLGQEVPVRVWTGSSATIGLHRHLLVARAWQAPPPGRAHVVNTAGGQDREDRPQEGSG